MDKDGDIVFKREGLTHFLLIYDTDPNYFHLVLPGLWMIDKDTDRNLVLEACNKVNYSSKFAKVFVPKDSSFVAGAIQMLIPDNYLKEALERGFTALSYASTNFSQVIGELTKSKPSLAK